MRYKKVLKNLGKFYAILLVLFVYTCIYLVIEFFISFTTKVNLLDEFKYIFFLYQKGAVAIRNKKVEKCLKPINYACLFLLETIYKW